MFSKITALFLLTFSTILAAAAPNPSNNQCNTGSAQCCNTVGTADSFPGLAAMAGTLGIVIQDLSTVVGLGCTPISVIGVGQSANCAQQPVCCSDNEFQGLINIGCTPISV